jgi:hypothetical protein
LWNAPRRSRLSHAQLAPAVDKTHRIQARLCLVIRHDLWEDSLIGKERMSQPVGVKMKTVIKVKELRDLAAGMKIDLVVTKNGGGVIVIDCDSEIQLQKFVQTLEVALIQVSIDSPSRAYVFARAFADAK